MVDRIGRFTVYQTHRFLVPKGESCSFELHTSSMNLEIRFIFDDDAKEQGAKFTFNGKGFVFELQKWDNSLGTSTINPIEIFQVDISKNTICR